MGTKQDRTAKPVERVSVGRVVNFVRHPLQAVRPGIVTAIQAAEREGDEHRPERLTLTVFTGEGALPSEVVKNVRYDADGSEAYSWHWPKRGDPAGV